MIDILLDSFNEYLYRGGKIISFQEWYDEFINTAYIMAEDVNVNINQKQETQKISKQSKESFERYQEYKRKRKKRGKLCLGYDEWLIAQSDYRDLKKDAAKAGIKIIGMCAPAAITGKMIKKSFNNKNSSGNIKIKDKSGKERLNVNFNSNKTEIVDNNKKNNKRNKKRK